ncbi:MAG: hypothetical protein LAT64_13115 [Phycisphaerales bacterium]|nr:hypothetical protein [Planctomycetota bacterium]MCH8509695.1 hypothetical protein [Phycisphaerales bacterium]
MFALDRDLLVLEPALLRDAAWAGQRTLIVNATLIGTTLTLAAGSFADAGVEPGSVALFDGLAIEFVEVLSPTEATVSLLRARRDGPALPPPPGTNRPLRVYSYGPQRELVHRAVLTMAGVDPDGDGPLTEASITNPGDLVRLEALGTLELVYAAADPAAGGPVTHAQRADMYRRRFHEERGRVSVFIDLDADGIAEARRNLALINLTRA